VTAAVPTLLDISAIQHENEARDSMTTLEVRNFAQIEHAAIELGDLTVLVGPQATGKSLLLQWFKMALDSGEVVAALKQAGHDVSDPSDLIDLVFGEGMAKSWDRAKTVVRFDGKDVLPAAWAKNNKKTQGRVFFIPAHRALLLADGWPAPFLRLNADTPVVARLFSQNLYQRFSGRKAAALFPVERILKSQYRKMIDAAVFHGGKVELKHEGLRYKLALSFDKKVSLPFMTWTAGQREFTPLLLGLYHVLPPRKVKKRAEVDYVVVEEPEMGLHPQAITTFMTLVLDLLWRGYKVVLSSHSPLVLDTVWAVKNLAANKAKPAHLAEALGIGVSPDIRKVMKHALRADYRVHFMCFDDKSGRVKSRDISGLDPMSEDAGESDWGGLTGFSSRLSDAVIKSVNRAELKE
jgi:hypothetical protein